MKVVKLLLLVFFSLTLIASCNDASSNDPTDDKDHVDNDGDSGTGGSGGNTGGTVQTRDLRENFLIVDGDSLFLTLKQVQPIFAGQPYRYQLNFSSRTQIDTTNINSQLKSIVGFQMSFKTRPTVSTKFNIISSRGGIDSTEVNFYNSHWINNGTVRDGQNFYSPNYGIFDVKIENSRFKAIIDSLELKNEVDTTDTYFISADWDFKF